MGYKLFINIKKCQPNIMCNFILRNGKVCNRYGKYQLVQNDKTEFYCKRHYNHFTQPKKEKPPKNLEKDKSDCDEFPAKSDKTDIKSDINVEKSEMSEKCIELKVEKQNETENEKISIPEKPVKDESYHKMMDIIRESRNNINRQSFRPDVTPVQQRRNGGWIFG